MADDTIFLKKMADQLIRHEGMELRPYQCPADRLTIGVGRNLEDKGITEEEALLLLENDIKECIDDLKTVFSDFEGLSGPVRLALVDMRFNLGPGRFRGFKKMIAAVEKGDFEKAAEEMKDSRWYGQVGARARTLVDMMKSGEGG